MSDAIKSKGVSLAAIFDPYVAGTTKARASGIDDAGTDTSNLYANIIYGSAAAATGIKSQNADLNTLYAKIGTASYVSPPAGNFIAKSFGVDGPDMDSNVTVIIKSDGTWQITTAGNGAATTPGASGTWLPAGDSASNYQVEFVWAQSSQYPNGPATITNGAATYQACTSNRSISVDAQVGQLTGNDKGSIGSITVNIKRISTGQVSAGICGVTVESAGSG